MVGVAGAVAAVEVVDTTEEEGLVANGQLVEAVKGRAHDHVALHEVARPAHVGDGGRVAQGARFGTHVIQGVERTVEEGLLLGNLTLVRHRSSPGLESASDDSR